MLTINDLTYRVGGRTLLEKANLSIGPGQRVGLVGPNGIGKSTLFKLIAKELQALGFELVTGIAKTGLAGIMKNGSAGLTGLKDQPKEGIMGPPISFM